MLDLILYLNCINGLNYVMSCCCCVRLGCDLLCYYYCYMLQFSSYTYTHSTHTQKYIPSMSRCINGQPWSNDAGISSIKGSVLIQLQHWNCLCYLGQILLWENYTVDIWKSPNFPVTQTAQRFSSCQSKSNTRQEITRQSCTCIVWFIQIGHIKFELRSFETTEPG